MTTPIPFHRSERNFRRFEDWIAQAVDIHPEPLKVGLEEEGLAPTTVVARLRDAISSFRSNEWESKVNREKFLRLRLHAYLSPGAGEARGVGSPQLTISALRTRASKAELSAIRGQTQDPQVATGRSTLVEDPSENVVRAFALLLSERLIDPVRFYKADEGKMKEWCKGFDVEIVQDGNILIMI